MKPTLRIVLPDGIRSCRVCGCTDWRACSGGCWWVGEDLCSACRPKSAGAFVCELVTEDRL
jgi:hypothetical protein